MFDDDSPFDSNANHEAFFDAEVLPLIREAMTRCRSRGLPLVACVQYAEERLCTFLSLPPGCSQTLMRLGIELHPDKFHEIPPAIAKA
jgi:hypothetical protein